MSKFPRNLKATELIRILKKNGFVETGGKGSHVRFEHPNGKWTQVAVHPKPIPIGTLRAILRQSGLDVNDL